MSAQVPAALPNGVRVAEPTYGAVNDDSGGDRPKATPESLSGQQQAPMAEPASWVPSELRPMGAGVVQPSVETTAMAAQGEQRTVPTTWDMGGRSTLERSAPATNAADTVGEFLTPRSTMGGRVTQPAWLAGVEVPRWVMRLGSLLQANGSGIPPSDLAPSPMPGTSPAYTPPPPGGHPFRLRSPTRARAIPPAPSPPSSSSVPAEAIQAEVQRQLQGIVGQLRQYGDENTRLRQELHETRALLRDQKERDNAQEEHTLVQPKGLLGDLAKASMDPGSLWGYPVPPERPPLPNLDSRRPGTAGVPEPCDDHLRHLGEQGLGAGGLRREPEILSPLPEDNTTEREAVPPREQGTASGLLKAWWEGRGRSQSPPPRPEPAQSGGSPVLDTLTRGIQQLQELQLQSLAKATSSTSTDVVKPGSVTLLPMPEARSGADSAVMFQDWVEVSSSVMGDLSESSSIWWRGVVDLVQATYEQWLAASPLERIGVEPQGSEQWNSGRWLRVNARASTMLLTSMPEDLRADMVARRSTQDCVRMLFRAFTYYQPGGSAERQDVLRRLQSPSEFAGGDSLECVLKTVRAWPRWLERCRAVKMAPPDASVLARGLLSLTDKHINSSTDAAFRTSMLRTTLRLDACPTTEQVQSYQRHLQAELEGMMVSKASSTSLVPSLRAVEPALQPKARDAGAKGSAVEMCKYFAKPSGCRRGDKCSYSHSMASLDKEARAKKCLRCGSEAHRQKDCTVGRSTPKQGSGTSKEQSNPKASTPAPTSQQSTMATMATSTTSSRTSDTIQGTPWTLEALVQAAQQVVQGQTQESQGDSSPEKTRPAMKVLRLRDLRVCSVSKTTTALVDSGATHSLRSARTPQEWLEAEEVSVQLAGSHQLVMRLSVGGTLLMPYKVKDDDTKDQDGMKAQTIVPMGQLIETLGYSMIWTPQSCFLTAPDGTRIPMKTESGCPEISELEALSLIARLEDRKLDMLNNEIQATSDKLSMSALAMEHHWNHYLYDYVSKGNFESGLRAVRDAPFFGDLPGECLSGLIPAAGLWSGWSIMKQIGSLSRPQRRKLWSSKRWIVHMFAGSKGHWEFFKLDQGGTSVLELDLDRCAGHNVLRDEVWRLLLWGAKEGKVDVVLGAPPGRFQEHAKGGTRAPKYLRLVARMMWLYVVAQVGREINGTGPTKDRDVGFIMEYPEGITQEERRERQVRVEQAEEYFRGPEERGSTASWEQTNSYWEHVQKPRWEEFAGISTMDARASFWDTKLWKSFQREAQLRTVSFDQGAMGGATRNRTTLGTNINNLMALDGLRVPEDDSLPECGENDHVWAPGLVRALVVATSFWDKDPRCVPRLCAMTPEKWKDHVDSNHRVFRKDCATCVMGRGIGRQHRRVHHPEAFVLTADVAGPLSPGLDPTSKGTMGKNLRYLLVAKYLVPKAFVEDYAGRPPPEDHGIPPERMEATKEDENFFGEMVTGKGNLEEHQDLSIADVEVIPENYMEDILDEEMSDQEPEEDDREEETVPDEKIDMVMKGGDCEPQK